MRTNDKEKHLQGKAHRSKEEAAASSAGAEKSSEDTDGRFHCKVCDKTMVNGAKATHLNCKAHFKNFKAATASTKPEQSTEGMFECKICDRKMRTNDMENHLQGKAHTSKVQAAASSSGATKSTGDTDGMFHCKVCDKTMVSGAKETHLNGKAHLKKLKAETASTNPEKASDEMFKCKICDRKIRTSDKDKHLQGKAHRSEVQALSKKTGGAARATGRNFWENLDPPFIGAEGSWVKRAKFIGKKSFGWFQCVQRRKRWSSAHSYKQFRQGCQRCEAESFPFFMWQNEEGRTFDDYDVQDRAPHDQDRCEACRKGVCTQSL